MKKFITALSLMVCIGINAQTNTLRLTWQQPAGWHSDLYSSTNLNGTWTLISTNSPDFTTVATQSQAFFTVIISPPSVNPAYIYINDPNTDGVRPEYTNLPAIAYSQDVSGPLFGWSVINQAWQ